MVAELVSEPPLAPGWQREAPGDARATLDALYRGAVFLLPPSAASLAFCDAVQALLVDAFGQDPESAHARLDGRTLFREVGRLRRVVYLEPRFLDRARAVIEGLGFDLRRVAFDPARVRAVLPRGEDNPRARAAYAAHRDTWYANPASTITVWLPLADLEASETFVFYPASFATPVDNDSAGFDYDDWVKGGWDRKIGWQDEDAGLTAHYPSGGASSATARRDGTGSPVGFSCRRGEQLVFAASHLHQTLPLRRNRIRFSLDLRFADLADVAAGRGAPSVGDRSRGRAIDDYVHPNRPWPPNR